MAEEAALSVAMEGMVILPVLMEVEPMATLPPDWKVEAEVLAVVLATLAAVVVAEAEAPSNLAQSLAWFCRVS